MGLIDPEKPKGKRLLGVDDQDATDIIRTRVFPEKETVRQKFSQEQIVGFIRRSKLMDC